VKAVGIDGIRVSLGFFDNIYIDPTELPDPSHFNEEIGTWQWFYNVRWIVYTLINMHSIKSDFLVFKLSQSNINSFNMLKLNINGFFFFLK